MIPGTPTNEVCAATLRVLVHFDFAFLYFGHLRGARSISSVYPNKCRSTLLARPDTPSTTVHTIDARPLPTAYTNFIIRCSIDTCSELRGTR